jgi:hypothetical protein
MAYIASDSVLGYAPDLYAVDTVGPGPLALAATSSPTYGRFERPGYQLRGVDPSLGGAWFMLVQFTGTVAAGGIVELSAVSVNSGARYDVSAQAWAGTVNSAKPLGVAMAAASAGQWGWVQLEGIAVANTSGTVAAGDKQYWQASGVISSTAVASKALLGAVAVSANNATYGSGSGAVTLSGQTLILLSAPTAQGPIT